MNFHADLLKLREWSENRLRRALIHDAERTMETLTFALIECFARAGGLALRPVIAAVEYPNRN
jgi:hypothetical protein